MSSLEGASKYLNNLLLARGLLQHGKMIDFAHPGLATESTDATMSQIINLVHDLVLRRDRDSEQHEAMAKSIRNMRTVETQQSLDLERMQEKNLQLQNDAATAQALDRSSKTALKKLETNIRELKEQNLKMKSMLDQVRSKCTSDVRKRDVEIDKLKSHLTGLQRGKKDVSGLKVNILNPIMRANGRERRGGQDVNSADWSLEKETNDFLAALVNETSTENVSLRQVVNDTLNSLRDMIDLQREEPVGDDDGIGIPGKYRKSRQTHSDDLVPVQELAQQISTLLDHCRSILKDPSFVRIEEVQTREEEIAKLRIGWEKMADRWKEAVTMMSQWKQRMLQEGRNLDVGELSDLSFGRSVALRPDGQPVLGLDEDLSSVFEESKLGDFEFNPRENDAVVEEESDLELMSEHAAKRLASSPAKRGVKIPRPSKPLGEVNGNANGKVRADHSVVQISALDDSSDIENDTFRLQKQTTVLPKLTVKDKLAMIEAEAVEAQEQHQQGLTRKRKVTANPHKFHRKGRRRSTLSPEELATLMKTS